MFQLSLAVDKLSHQLHFSVKLCLHVCWGGAHQMLD